MKKYRKCSVSEIFPIGDDGFYAAYLTVDDHGEAIRVIGKDLTETIERAMVVVNAFNKEARSCP